MLLTLIVGLLGAYVFAVASSAVVLALDEDPAERNLRQIRERAALAASRSETREHGALLDSSALPAEPARSNSPLSFAPSMR